jgi:hypothetical protein
MKRRIIQAGATLLWMLAAAGGPLHGQVPVTPGSPSPTDSPPFAAGLDHDGIRGVLATLEAMQAEVYRHLLVAGETPARGGTLYDVLADMAVAPASPGMHLSEGSTTVIAAAAPRIAAILERTYRFQHRIHAILLDPGVADQAAAVEQALSDYRSDPQHSLPPVPKSMDVVHHDPSATSFRRVHAEANGVLWSARWLQLALLEPLLLAASPAEAAAGIDTTVARYRAKLASGREGHPVEMPTPPAIAPELVRLYPEVAAILDNLNLLHELVADLLADRAVADRYTALERVADRMTDPEYMPASEYDWIVMALRHGIYNQGGPALGVLSRSERNRGPGHLNHGSHGGAAVMPGMGTGAAGVPSGGGPTGADGPGAPAGDGGHGEHDGHSGP